MKEQFRTLKRTGQGSIEIENFTVTYDPEKETDSVANFGPWSIEGDMENIPISGINGLGVILDTIREIEKSTDTDKKHDQ